MLAPLPYDGERALRERRDGLGPLIALVPCPDGDRALLGLAVADDEHVGHLAQLGLADLAPDGLRALVELGPQARCVQLGEHLAPGLHVAVAIGRTAAWTGVSHSGNSPA